MCRIAGIITKEQFDLQRKVIAMRDTMMHGGPDDEGVYVDAGNGVALGHRRLSIIDLSSAGHQPMSAAGGDLQITFNGEIYNYPELKEELFSLGHHFSTQSDTEVILKAYQQWGNHAWSKLNGMFALAIYDKKNGKIVLARDHAGIKPLYYSHTGTSFYFSSEVKAFKSIDPKWKENPNWPVYFLAFGHLPEPVTTLSAVVPLPKGHYMELNLADLTMNLSHFNEFRFTSQIIDEKEAIHKIRTELEAAVKRHLISDAPIGLFLSGGIDSSILTLIAKKFKHEDIHTLSINFDSAAFSEQKYQDIIIHKTGAHHQSYRVTQQDFENEIPGIFKAMDQPSGDGVNTYFISKYARAYGLKAVLSGLGADELLGGYPSFKYRRTVSMIRKLPSFVTASTGNIFHNRLRKMDYLTMDNDTGEYLFYRGIFIVNDIARILDCTEDEVLRILNKLPLSKQDSKLANGNKASNFELNYYMQNQLLKDSDYMSMWHGLEIRVPFLDKYFMQLTHSIDAGVKFNHKQGKYLLIKAFEDVLPREIWDRKKQGFIFPLANWLMNSPLFTEILDKRFNDYSKLFGEGKLTWSRMWTLFVLEKNKLNHD
jgi:asparagine synthase (glutamine-hydrolysing)